MKRSRHLCVWWQLFLSTGPRWEQGEPFQEEDFLSVAGPAGPGSGAAGPRGGQGQSSGSAAALLQCAAALQRHPHPAGAHLGSICSSADPQLLPPAHCRNLKVPPGVSISPGTQWQKTVWYLGSLCGLCGRPQMIKSQRSDCSALWWFVVVKQKQTDSPWLSDYGFGFNVWGVWLQLLMSCDGNLKPVLTMNIMDKKPSVQNLKLIVI